MKYVLATGAALALFAGTALPSLATPPVACTPAAHYSDATLPPVCLVADTKTKHPDWYRDGGYCAGGAATKDVTGFSQDEDCGLT